MYQNLEICLLFSQLRCCVAPRQRNWLLPSCSELCLATVQCNAHDKLQLALFKSAIAVGLCCFACSVLGAQLYFSSCFSPWNHPLVSHAPNQPAFQPLREPEGLGEKNYSPRNHFPAFLVLKRQCAHIFGFVSKPRNVKATLIRVSFYQMVGGNMLMKFFNPKLGFLPAFYHLVLR